MKKTPKDNMDKVVKTVKASKQKVKKFRLISYTMKATIPTGQYANIQPEVTVEAESIEAAERAVMPYFETLFAKYRDGGVKPIVPITPAPSAPMAPKPFAPATVNNQTAPIPPVTQEKKPEAPLAPVTQVNTAPVSVHNTPHELGGTVGYIPKGIAGPTAPVAPAILLTVPFTRAKAAIDSCTSHDALKLVSDQIEKSTKLIDTEKVELKKAVTIKYNDITIAKTV